MNITLVWIYSASSPILSTFKIPFQIVKFKPTKLDSHSKNKSFKMTPNCVFKLQMALANPLSKSFKRAFSIIGKKNHKKFGNEAAKVKDRVSFNRETVIQTREEWKKMSVRAEIEKLEKQSNNWKTMPFRILPCLCYLFRKSIQTRGNGMILPEEEKMEKKGRVMFSCTSSQRDNSVS